MIIMIKKISSQKADVTIEENIMNDLDKYCMHRNVRVSTLVDQIISAWVERAVKAWKTNPNLIPELPVVSEKKTVTVEARKPIVIKFRKASKFFGLNETNLLSWLAGIYIKQKNLKRLAEYKHDRRPWKT